MDPASPLSQRQRHLRRSAEVLRRTPQQAAGVAFASPLTDREREIAALAERLVLSVRTVDDHLHRIHGKLGSTHRAELPGAR